MSSILSSRDINAPITTSPSPNGPNTKDTTNNKPTTTTKNMSMDYHRQVLQSKLNEDKSVSLLLPPPNLSWLPPTFPCPSTPPAAHHQKLR
jgi:hypothetical protein